MKKIGPIRMCISCRIKFPQKTLIRLVQLDKTIVKFTGRGRSFYLCQACLKEEKKVRGLAKRFKQEHERFVKLLVELAK